MNTLIKTKNTSAQEQRSTCASNLCSSRHGFALLLVLMGVIILMALIIGSNMTDYQVRLQAVQIKSQTEAMLAAEAGYESAIFWMSQQEDILGSIQQGSNSGSISFANGATCSYTINFHGWLGQKPIFEVLSTGVSGRPSFTRTVDVNVIQETCGWAMGSCTIPGGTSIASESPVYFGNGEIIDMPIHINKQNDNPDVADIFISGTPTFLQPVEMGEDRYTSGGTDKYSGIMSLFQDGITFDQPTVRITDATAVQDKVTRFKNSTLPAYQFTPAATAPSGLSFPRCSAVQLEFYVKNGVGMVRIDPNCTVTINQRRTLGLQYRLRQQPDDFPSIQYLWLSLQKNLRPLYYCQNHGYLCNPDHRRLYKRPGGQIYVNGNVVIGGGEDANFTDQNNMVVNGTMTVVATGNIWIADSIKVDGPHDTTLDPNGIPSATNTNVLGLIAQGVIKVVDPGLAPDLTYNHKRTTLIGQLESTKPGNTADICPTRPSLRPQ